jgi:hypothetical protein
MKTITQLVSTMQEMLGKTADQIARETGFIQRQVKVTGSSFAQTLVYGFLSNPKQTYGEMRSNANMIGLHMSAQGLEQRFNERASEFMQALLEEITQKAIEGRSGVDMALLNRFNGVYMQDSSIIELPRELKEVWRGMGGTKGENASLKLQVNLNYSTGEIHGPTLQDGRAQDQTSPYQQVQFPKGALHVNDLGYFSLKRFQRDSQNGVFWLSRYKTSTKIYFETGNSLHLITWLRKQKEERLDLLVLLGGKAAIPCRLLIEKVPKEVADQRRRYLKRQAVKRGQKLTKERSELANWTIIITNVPQEMASFDEIMVLLRARWQIELLFKLWKSYLKVDEWRSENPWRILCEIYAKLIGAVISQWIFSIGLWDTLNRSVFKAIRPIQTMAMMIASTLQDTQALTGLLNHLLSCLPACTQEKRKKHPSTFQLFHACVSSQDGAGVVCLC